MIINYSLHKIENESFFGFSPSSYSKFKFGDESVAEEFGRDLAIGFIKSNADFLRRNNLLMVIPSPYFFIPTATFAMKIHFINELNCWLVENGLPVVKETKVSRSITYKEDYGKLNAEERIQLIGNDQFHIDKEIIKNHTLLFLDDIKITGSHEKMIMKMVADYSLKNNIFLLYFAELINKSIHPSIENYLNYYSVKELNDLFSIINHPHFFINTRIVKYILNSSDDSFYDFIIKTTKSFRRLLYNMAIGNSYHTIDTYKSNIDVLRRSIK
jgi:hypothetical protein